MDTSLRSDPHKLRFRTFARFSLRVFCSTSSSDKITMKKEEKQKTSSAQRPTAQGTPHVPLRQIAEE
jgi:hypothetical protein